MPLAVVLCNNIYDDNGVKHTRGETIEISQDLADEIISGDELAEREPRITVVQPPKKSRTEKAIADENR